MVATSLDLPLSLMAGIALMVLHRFNAPATSGPSAPMALGVTRGAKGSIKRDLK